MSEPDVKDDYLQRMQIFEKIVFSNLPAFLRSLSKRCPVKLSVGDQLTVLASCLISKGIAMYGHRGGLSETEVFELHSKTIRAIGDKIDGTVFHLPDATKDT